MHKHEPQIKQILKTFKSLDVSVERTALQILYATGHRKSYYCKIDNLRENCNVANVGINGCDSCGNYVNK